LWEKVIRPDELNRVPMDLRCLLIESSEGPVLVDTGYGAKLSAKQMQQLNLVSPARLLDDLAAAGYRPEDVRMVINTHLHADHCSGNTYLDAAGQPRPTFPNATYLVQRLELADATYPNERTRNTYFAENFLPLRDLRDGKGESVLRVLHGDTQITSEVRVQVTPGHTRAHQVVIIESQGETAVFLADAGYVANLERIAWVPAFDVEPLASIETKRALRDWAWRRNALLFFQHDIAIPAGRIRPEGDGWRVVRQC
jgi:glyoxylase-like metal-dependent hydrolase (beta-lactamase superfamily II)